MPRRAHLRREPEIPAGQTTLMAATLWEVLVIPTFSILIFCSVCGVRFSVLYSEHPLYFCKSHFHSLTETQVSETT